MGSDSDRPDDAFERVLAGNTAYASSCTADKPSLWKTLAQGQSPDILWFGCGDSRVPETTICGCEPGDMFVHRNIANLLVASDPSSSAIIDFAVGVVKVKKVIVCGHTSCGGAINSLHDKDLGPALNAWLTPLRELRKTHQADLDRIDDADARANRLAMLNVQMGLDTLRQNPTVQKAIAERGLTLHGLVFDIPSSTLKPVSDDAATTAPAANAWQHR
ncbi:carbonic anhydrase [Saccharata proteae CBS 121410]|uniref:Carbonic anhydrase n=1 Tax=Saccharata proteae CBS 121410 TaxID=1314787 RepID=A0A6A5YD73_9PEZI|nr:carbonic anhydrase [Saccharata proteae CBS 121410]